MSGYKPLKLIYVLVAVLHLTACGGKSNSSDNETQVDPQTLSFTLNNNVYAAIHLDEGDWQPLTNNAGATYTETPEVATVLSICGNNILLQQRTFETWKSLPSINPDCPATSLPTVNPVAPRQISFEFPSGSILYDMAISSAGGFTDPAANQRVYSVIDASLSFTAVFEVSGQLYYLHEKDFDVSVGSAFSLTTENASPIAWLSDAYDNAEPPLGGYEPFYIEDDVRFSMTPFTDEQRYDLDSALTQNGYFEHKWYSVNTDQIRTNTSANFKITFPGLISTNSLNDTVSISQDAKTIQLAVPQQVGENPMPLSKMVAQVAFSDRGNIRFEIDGDTCSEGSCSLTLESPSQLPGFVTELSTEAAEFNSLSINTQFRWFAQLIQTTDSKTDTVLISEDSLLPLF
jgi:hypothetical protein